MLGNKLDHVVGEGFWLQRINGLSIHIERQTGVGNTGNRQGGVFSQKADRFAHMLWASGTVKPDDIYAHAFENGQRSVDVGAEQHPTSGVECNLGLQRQACLGFVKGLMNTADGGFDFENVLRCFD